MNDEKSKETETTTILDFPMGGEDQQNNYYDQEIEINKKEQHCENHS